MRFSRKDERGAVTAFVIGFVFALLLVAGLVIDGGFILSARRQAINEAEAAARAGAQAVISPDSSKLDSSAAKRLAQTYLDRTGHEGSVSVTGDVVAVDVRFDRPMFILGLGGLHSVSIEGHGEAQGIRGVNRDGDL